MIKHLLSFLVIALLVGPLRGQIGGINTFEFLNLSPSARVSGLGGNLITVRDDDVNLAYANPSLLNAAMHQQISFSHNFHVGGVSNGFATYGHHLEKWKTTFYGGVQYVNYGEFNATNELGEIEGTFNASEYAVALGGGYQLNERLAVGANLKFITSQLEGYSSLGLTSDLAAVYFDTSSNFTFTFLFKNIGSQLSTFREGNFEPLPFEMQVGLSKRLRHLPFRFSIIYHHFDRWNILYDDPDSEETTLFLGEVAAGRSESSIFFDNLFRHFIFNGEFLFGRMENFRLRVGYNHFMRKELTVDNLRSTAGFSFGAGIKINRFRLDYGHTSFHLAGGLNHLTISTNFREFRK